MIIRFNFLKAKADLSGNRFIVAGNDLIGMIIISVRIILLITRKGLLFNRVLYIICVGNSYLDIVQQDNFLIVVCVLGGNDIPNGIFFSGRHIFSVSFFYGNAGIAGRSHFIAYRLCITVVGEAFKALSLNRFNHYRVLTLDRKRAALAGFHHKFFDDSVARIR